MYQTSLLYKLKAGNNEDQYRIFRIFFMAWIDESCNNEVDFTELRNTTDRSIQVNFERQEDAVALKLKGIPTEFRNYLNIVN